MTVANTTFPGQAGQQAARTPAPSVRGGPRVVPEQAPRPQPSQSAERTQQSNVPNDATTQGRLAFDQELSRVFVEIVDKDSGEVVLRFPPEQIVRHIAELKQAKEAAKADDTGLVLDQVV